MKLRTLGRTGLQVSELGLGGLFVSDLAGVGLEETRRAVHRALDLGVTYFDTAPTYANSEETLGLCLEGVQRPHIVSTKLGGRPKPFDPQSKDGLRRSIDESLRLLKRDRVDILMVHEPDRPGQYDWWDDWESFHGPVRELLDDLKQEGLIRFTGLGGTTAYELARVMRCGYFDVVLTAFNYSVLWREAAVSVLPEAAAQNMGVVLGSPLHQGVLARRFDVEVNDGAPWMSPPRREQFRTLYRFLDEIDLSLPEIGLRLPLSDPRISTVLMGARSVSEVEQNAVFVNKGPLPADILALLSEIAAMVPFRPCEEPFFLPLGRDYRGPGPAV